MEIVITQEHIEKGKAMSCNSCPVALAIADSWQGATNISVGPNHMCVGVFCYRLPRKVVEFIDMFDQGILGLIEPMSFNIYGSDLIE